MTDPVPTPDSSATVVENTGNKYDQIVKGALAIIVVAGGFVLLRGADAALSNVVSSMMTIVLMYHFGSTSSNHSKDATIANLSKPEKP